MPINPVSRAYVTRAAVVATTSAAAVLLSVLPAGGATATDPAPSAAAAAVPALTAPAAGSAPVPTFPAAVPVVEAAPVVETEVETVAASSGAAGTAVTNAMSKLGASYKWGGNGPSSFDCSGLVNWAYKNTGVELPRTSRALSQVGVPVSRSNLQPGDLVFFYSPVSHVGIYIGDGKMVHASSSSKPVAVDSIDGRDYNSARRVA